MWSVNNNNNNTPVLNSNSEALAKLIEGLYAIKESSIRSNHIIWYDSWARMRDAKLEEQNVEHQIDLSQLKHKFNNGLENFKTFNDKMLEAQEEQTNYGNTEAYNKLREKATEAFNKFIKEQEEAEKLVDFLKKSKENFSPSDIFEQYEHFVENFKNYLSTLSIEQTFAFLHIIFFIVMIILVYNIAIVFYSELFIKYLSIDNKYPKFARFIEIRRKFQRYYMTWNLIVLLIILIILLLLNLLVFLNLI